MVFKRLFFLVTSLAFVLAACSFPNRPALHDPNHLVIYSGRSESLVGPIIDQFEETSGIRVDVRWGDTPELAATLLEEGTNSPADVFFAQEPGGLGAVIEMLTPLPDDLLNQVAPRFRDPQGRWVGISGRARTIVYNTQSLSPADLPEDLWGLTADQWQGRIGWAPTNASFQTMITAMRALWGQEETTRWLTEMLANDPIAYEKNTPIVAAVGVGEVDLGLVNHYYLYRFLQEEGESFPARNYYLPDSGPGSLVMVAGAGILETAPHPDPAEQFIDFLLSPVAQQYFATQTYEYPLVEGVVTARELPALADLNATNIDLADLADLQGTIALLRETGVLP
ncbi:MAG: iron ABC transporter substrate-binding protein [Anaerolineales bacterium]|jgi:iron(III) transport system substrate-binding protein